MPGNGDDGAHRVWLGTLTPTISASGGAVTVVERPRAPEQHGKSYDAETRTDPSQENESARSQLIPLPSAGAIASQLQPFGRLGQYRLLKPIGEGGTALVYRAVGPGDRMVAVKTLRLRIAGNAAARSRIAREISAMQRVQSPFVAEVIDADMTGIIPYLVTTLLEGPTLAAVVARQGPLRSAMLQRVAYGLAEGLAAVHAAGLIHRDLKPGNVVLAGGDPVLIDFGIAYHPDDAPLTQTGTFVGTPGYLASEVIKGQRAQASADIFAWGATVGFAARGEPVYGTGSNELVFSRILGGEADLDGIHGALHPLVAAALSRQPRDRPTAAWLAREVAGLDLAAPPPRPAIRPATWLGTTAPSPPRTASRASIPEPIACEVAKTDSAAPDIAGSDQATPDQATPDQATPDQATPDQAAPPPRPASPPAIWRGTIAPGQPRTVSRPSMPQQVAHQVPAEVADLLPAVQYAPVRTVISAGISASRVVRIARPRKHPLLAMTALAMAVTASFVLPVIGTLMVAALLTLLAAGSRVRKGLADRRYARGRRAWDSFVGTVSFPWALARSVVETALLAPILLAAAVVAVAADMMWFRGPHVHSAWAAVAVIYTALSCLGPWSRPARRELNRVLGAIASSPGTVAVTVLSASAVAAVIAALLFIGTPPTWPLHPRVVHIHISGFNPASFHG